jgi:2'-5' RNA ligase
VSALSDPENVELVVIDECDTPPVETGMTEDEAYQFLTGRALVAAAEPDPLAGLPNIEGVDEDVSLQDSPLVTGQSVPYQDETGVMTGAMIALVPSEADLDRLVIAGGEPREELHLTLFYLGTAADTDPATQEATTFAVGEVVTLEPAVTVTGFGAALWNPLGEDPAVVLNVGGEALNKVRDMIEDVVETVWTAEIPEQHCPWVPHVCLAYATDVGVVAEALTRVGQITFDRVRVAWADRVTDFPLYASAIAVTPEAGDGMTAATRTVLQTESLAASGEAPVFPPNQAAALEPRGSWTGPLVVEGIETGDGREFAVGSLDFAPVPAPLSWAKENLGEHMGSVVVARIDQMWRDPANAAVIQGRGVFNLDSPEGLEAYRQVQAGFLKGVSVDVDSVKDADVEYVYAPDDGMSDAEDEGGSLMDLFAAPEKMIFHKGRIRGATLVALPAFVEAEIKLTDGTMVVPMDSAPASGAPQVGYALTELGHACGDSIDATACAVGVGRLLSDAGLRLNMAQRRGAYEHLRTHLESVGLTPQPFELDALSDDVRALVSSATVTDYPAPPGEWFEEPRLSAPTPLTITDDGHVFGHAALWDTCHTSFADACTTPPREGQHVYYRLGEVVTAEGARVAVGSLTLGTGHAPTFGIDPRRAAEHYDNTGTCVADVASGEDEHGIWVSGALRSGLTPSRVQELRGAKLSGDWRRIGGEMRLIALLAVNTPGFGVPRLRTEMSGGRQLSLVAAGIMPNVTQQSTERVAIKSMVASLARRMGRDPQARVAELCARVHKND